MESPDIISIQFNIHILKIAHDKEKNLLIRRQKIEMTK